MKFKTAAMAVGIAMLGGVAVADSTPPAWYTNTSIHGYVDANYGYYFNGLAPVAGSTVFNTTDQMFTLNGAKLAIANNDAASGTGGEVDLLYGPMADIYNGTATTAALAIEQAFLTQAFGPVTFTLGKAETFVGFEGTDTPSDYNYSRSLLFGQEPFYNTGVKASWAATSTLTILGYMGDGNSVDVGTANHPDFGAQVGFTGISNLSLTGTYYDNPNTTLPAVGGLWTNNDMFNFVATYQAMPNLGFAGEYLYSYNAVPSDSSEPKGIPSIDNQGYSLYADYATPVAGLKVDPRFSQYYFNPYAAGIVPGLDTVVDQLTVTVKYAKGPLTHYLEFTDTSTPNKSFMSGAGAGATAVQSQNSLTYAATYTF
jgi:hypothetical protein